MIKNRAAGAASDQWADAASAQCASGYTDQAKNHHNHLPAGHPADRAGDRIDLPIAFPPITPAISRMIRSTILLDIDRPYPCYRRFVNSRSGAAFAIISVMVRIFYMARKAGKQERSPDT